MNLQESITRVARLRILYHTEKEEFHALQEAWKTNNKPLIDLVNDSGEALKVAEDELRTAALQEYGRTDNAKPIPGVEIKQKTVFTYNPGVALAWAQEHHLCLTLDDRRFKGLILGGYVDCATVASEPTCTIAKDLSQYVDEKD